MRALTHFEATRVTGATGCHTASSCQPAPSTCQPRKSAFSCLVDFAYFAASLCKPRTSCTPKPCEPKPSCGGSTPTPTPTNPPVDL
jgi:hypothetical protein